MFPRSSFMRIVISTGPSERLFELIFLTSHPSLTSFQSLAEGIHEGSLPNLNDHIRSESSERRCSLLASFTRD